MPDPIPWNVVAIDGEPESDLSGNVTLFEVYDGAIVRITGRVNDTWMPAFGEPIAVTHWKLWEQAPPPPESDWTLVEEFGALPNAFVALVEVYDGETTNLTAWYGGENGQRIFEIPNMTHWKYPTLSDPPEDP